MASVIEQLMDLFVFTCCKSCEPGLAMAKNWRGETTVVLSEKLRKQFETKRSITLTMNKDYMVDFSILNCHSEALPRKKRIGGFAYDKH